MSYIINPFFVAPAGPVTPDEVTGLVRWYKADTYALSDGDTVGEAGREWIDQSVSGVDATSDPGNRPLYRTNIFGAMPAIQFVAASSLFLRQADLVIAGNFTLIAIAAVTADSCVMGDLTDNIQFGRIFGLSANTISVHLSPISGAESDVFANAQTVVRMMTWRRTVGGIVSFREQTTARGSVADPAGDVAFTSKQIGLGGSGFATGHYGEICVYTGAMSDAQVDSLYNAYFKVRYPTLP